jgi:hypothetical protein
MNRKTSIGGLLLAGLAGLAYYKYSQMSPEDKQQMMDNLKEKGRKIYDSIPENIKNMFGKKEQMNPVA